uniref:TSA: Wollemia nobilis Ref_Wollemi_Transcript_4240_2379 transcribed RNA sequence n=1 Tax=Wollemia nobilis TaxID=56998 RepID=A0A0C9S8L2_9CONI
MAKAMSGFAYPDRFYAAAAYAGFGDSAKPATTFSNETALLLYDLYQQATVGPRNVPKPRAWNPEEQSKRSNWNGPGKLASTEAMRLFVKILEEEDPAWYSRVSEPVVETGSPCMGSAADRSNSFTMSNGTAIENGAAETEDKLLEGLLSVSGYDSWVALPSSGRRPVARYEHAAEVVQGKMYVIGGNHNGRYLNDIQVLDLKTMMWSKIEPKLDPDCPSNEAALQALLPPCAGHSLIRWGTKLLAVAGHTKEPSDTVTVRAFDTEKHTWSILESHGKAPLARGGQSVTLVGSSLVIFGGEDSRRRLLNDLHILDLKTMTWDAIETVGTPPEPRSEHTASVHADRYLLIFAGGSHSTCFSDLHVLDLQSMEWSQPEQPDDLLTPRAGHAGVTIGERWYIVGGGDNKRGVSKTLVLNMPKLVWSVVTTVEGRTPIASEGLSLVSTSVNGDDILIAFGGYNGRYNNEIQILKRSHKVIQRPKILESPAAAAAAASVAAAYAVPPVPVPTMNGTMVPNFMDDVHESKVREIRMDNPKLDPVHQRSDETRERTMATLKAEKEDLETKLLRVQAENSSLSQGLTEAQTTHEELIKELQSVRGQLATEQSRCFKLEVDVAELHQKFLSVEALQKEAELLRRQKAASDEAAAHAAEKQNSGGVWRWIAGSPQV